MFSKGDKAEKLYLIVSGEMLLDVSDSAGQSLPKSGDNAGDHSEPFINSPSERCFHISGGSMLGDEGILGEWPLSSEDHCSMPRILTCYRCIGGLQMVISL